MVNPRVGKDGTLAFRAGGVLIAMQSEPCQCGNRSRRCLGRLCARGKWGLLVRVNASKAAVRQKGECYAKWPMPSVMQDGLLPKRYYAKWPIPKRCYVKWLAAKAMLCEVACCQSYAMRSGLLPKRCYAKWLAAK